MDITDINLKIQSSDFIEELNDFNTLRKLDEIPDYNSVLKFHKHRDFYKKLCYASWESHGDTKISNKKLAEISGLSERQVSRIITKFKKLGLISCLHVRGHKGEGVRYNKHGDVSHKKTARSRYWTSRTIRIHWILAVNKYYVKYNLGWKNDFRPKPNLDFDKIKKTKDGSHLKLALILDKAVYNLKVTKGKIPLKFKITEPLTGRNTKTKQKYLINPVFTSKTQMIRDGYLWQDFFNEFGKLAALRGCYGSKDDVDVQKAIGLLGYTDTYRIRRNFAIKKQASNNS